MTTTVVNPITIDIVMAGGVMTLLGITLIVLLIALLLLKESLRLFETPTSNSVIQMLDILILPLLLATGFVLYVRLMTISGLQP